VWAQAQVGKFLKNERDWESKRVNLTWGWVEITFFPIKMRASKNRITSTVGNCFDVLL
jgi:hypothetical protein